MTDAATASTVAPTLPDPSQNPNPPQKPSSTRRWLRTGLVACLLLGSFLLFRGATPKQTASNLNPAASAAIAPIPSGPKYATTEIQDLRKGDMVLARNPATGEMESRRVVDVFERTTYRLRILTIRGPDGRELPPIRTTDEHPFWVVDLDDFLPAGNLKPGDRFLAPDGEETTLAATRVEVHPEGVTVHNFEVEGAHTYFVLPGEQQSLHGTPVLVHNTCGGAGRVPKKKVATPRGANHPKVKSATARGRQAHREFAEKVKRKPGWQSEKTIKGPDGKTLRPDAIDPKGRPIELKPNTPSGRRQGARQIEKYMEAMGANGRVIYYDP